MATDTSTDTLREAVGVFDDAESLQAAADELMSSGFDRACLSLVAGQTTVEEKLGHMYRKVEDIEDDPSVPRTAYTTVESLGDAEGAAIGALLFIPAVCAAGAIVASGGALAAAVGAAALAGGSGALVGGIFASWLEKHHADYLVGQLDRGGILLWVRTFDEGHEKRATEILSKHSARDVHVHELPG